MARTKGMLKLHQHKLEAAKKSYEDNKYYKLKTLEMFTKCVHLEIKSSKNSCIINRLSCSSVAKTVHSICKNQILVLPVQLLNKNSLPHCS